MNNSKDHQQPEEQSLLTQSNKAILEVQLLQRMNYHASNLPFFPKCPPEPRLGASLSLQLPDFSLNSDDSSNDSSSSPRH